MKIWASYCTISFNSNVTHHTQFSLTPPIIFSRFMVILEICRKNKKVMCCLNWMKWYSYWHVPHFHHQKNPVNLQKQTLWPPTSVSANFLPTWRHLPQYPSLCQEMPILWPPQILTYHQLLSNSPQHGHPIHFWHWERRKLSGVLLTSLGMLILVFFFIIECIFVCRPISSDNLESQPPGKKFSVSLAHVEPIKAWELLNAPKLLIWMKTNHL